MEAFVEASHDWIAAVRAAIQRAESPERQLEALVWAALPDDAKRRGEWRLWCEMWTYAARDPDFASQLIETDALWEQEIRAVLERTREAGAIREMDVALEARLLARLIDGLGLWAWLSGRWPEARAELVAHLAKLGVSDGAIDRMRAALVMDRRVNGRRYERRRGMWNSTDVPSPGTEEISNRPPAACTLARALSTPK